MQTPAIKYLDDPLIKALSARADAADRRRVVHRFHDALSDPVQRFLNVMQPGSYVRPHRHDDPAKWEMIVVLAGRLAFLVTSADGIVLQRIELDAMGPVRGIEVPAGVWHTSAVLAPDTALLEIKRGPYQQSADKDFADWAPAEGDAACDRYERLFRAAMPGDRLAVG